MKIDIQTLIENGAIIRLDADHYIVGWGQRFWSSEKPLSNTISFYFPDFFLRDSTPWFHHEFSKIVSVEDLIQLILVSDDEHEHQWINPHFPVFEKAFDQLKMLFSQGTLKKAVPYVFDESSQIISKAKLLNSLKKLIRYTRSLPLHVYGFWSATEGILGASPEILFEYSADVGQLITIACAGTAKKREDFTYDSKILAEHRYVVDGIAQSLSPYGEVTVGKLGVVEFPRLSHLVTPIQAKMQNTFDFSSIVQALHPTPALGVFPKKVNWLEGYEKMIPRGRFGAPVGCIWDQGKQMKCIVGIRNMQWNAEGIKVGAGCGIVAGSDLKSEWEEIGLKIASIKEMLSFRI